MQHRPIGICNTCGNYAYQSSELGEPCHAHHHGEVCSGMVKSADYDNLWEPCPACRAQQVVDCPQCAGRGWLYLAPGTA